MRFGRLSVMGAFNGAVTPFGRELTPAQRASAEMQAYDALPPEARKAVAESPNDVALTNRFLSIRQRGAPRHVLERLHARGLMPYQVGEGGILAELVLEELNAAPAPEKSSA